MSEAPAPLVIVGPTASGKSALAVALAGRVPGAEVISADAMAVYRTMDVGTAKPTPGERAGVPHHLIDVADPGEEYTVARFQAEAVAVLADLAARHATPILVGGTGLYVRAVVDRLTLPGQYPEVRRRLEEETSTAALHRRLTELDPVAAARMLATNRRRIVRALEVTLGSGRPFSSFGPGIDAYPPTRFRQVGLRLDRHELDQRIDRRYDRQLADGFVDEVAALSRRPLSRTASQALGYAEVLGHLRGETTLDEALDHARRRTKRFARRQERWFRRDPRITWFEARDPHLTDRVNDWWRKPSGEPST
ncbi:MAG: tRNA (adenosine(37)-N6)-dimethylallyltransferase MiaA [Acidimicrobiales bacterium]